MAWLRRKLSEPCACGSKEPYRRCCLRLEACYFGIAVVIGFALFLGRDQLEWIGIPVAVVAALVAFLIRGHMRRR
jgi:hypothetical protein